MASKDDIKDLKEDISRVEFKLENETNDEIRALFDDREIQKETNEIINTLERIEAKVEVLQIETDYIRRIK